MTRLSPLVALFAVSALAAGCSSGANSGTASAAANSPSAASTSGPVLTDTRTGLKIYPGALRQSTSDSNGTALTSFGTSDSLQTVGAWYKSILPPTFTETDKSSESSPTIEFDRTEHDPKTGDKRVQEVYLEVFGGQTTIGLEHFTK